FFWAAALAGANVSGMITSGWWHDFTTSPALDPSDFNCFGSVMVANAAVVLGGAFIHLNFWPINHSPNPIICDSRAGGLGLGGGWMPGRFSVRTDVVVKFVGSAQLPLDGSVVEVLDDSDDLVYDWAGLLADSFQNNTDPDYMT